MAFLVLLKLQGKEKRRRTDCVEGMVRGAKTNVLRAVAFTMNLERRRSSWPVNAFLVGQSRSGASSEGFDSPEYRSPSVIITRCG